MLDSWASPRATTGLVQHVASLSLASLQTFHMLVVGIALEGDAYVVDSASEVDAYVVDSAMHSLALLFPSVAVDLPWAQVASHASSDQDSHNQDLRSHASLVDWLQHALDSRSDASLVDRLQRCSCHVDSW